MRELALMEEGATLYYATSYHDEYMPDNVIDRSSVKPWITNGFYPQSLIITFPAMMQISSVDIKSANVKDLQLSRSTSDSPVEFEDFGDSHTLEATKGTHQKESLMTEGGGQMVARHLKLTIKSGHDHFCGVFRLHVMGQEASGDQLLQQQMSMHNNARSVSGYDFGGNTPQSSPSGPESGSIGASALSQDRFQFSFGQQQSREERVEKDQFQFQSTFRLPSSKKKRVLDDGPAVGGSMYGEDPEDEETAAGIRDDDDGADLDDDQSATGGEELQQQQPWNPRLGGDLDDGDDEDNQSQEGRFGF